MPPPFLTDNFTDTSGNDLNTHTSDSGHTWTRYSGSGAGGNCTISAANRLCGDGTSSLHTYSTSASSASAEYDVTADIVVVSVLGSNDITGFCVRMDPAAAGATYYKINLQASGTNFQCQKLINNSATTIGSNFGVSITPGDVLTVKFQCRDAQKDIFLSKNGTPQNSGSPIFTFADNSITAAGKVGVITRFSTTTTGFHLDNLSVVDYIADPFPAGYYRPVNTLLRM